MRKCDVNILQIYPSQLSDIATLPREIKKSHFQRYYSYTVLIIYVVSFLEHSVYIRKLSVGLLTNEC